MKRIKREKEELEERNQILMNEMRSCVKHFYPTSWKQSDQYSHSRIENWDHQTITKNAQERFYFDQVVRVLYPEDPYLVKCRNHKMLLKPGQVKIDERLGKIPTQKI